MKLRATTWHRLPVCLALLLTAGCSGAGNGSSAQLSGSLDGPALPWPPADTAPRQTSDNDVILKGSEFSASGGGAAAQGDFCLIGPGGALNYAIYPLSGLGVDVVPKEITVEYLVTEETSGDGTALYLGLSNYSASHWEWYELDPSPGTTTYPIPADYVSPLGNSYAALALGGPGTGRVDSVMFTRTGAGAATDVPQNLVGVASFGAVTLDWDEVPRAESYRVYRSYSPDFSGELKANAGVLTDNHYVDDDMGSDMDVYYRVTAVRGTESERSEGIMVHTLDTTLPAPQNLTASAAVGNVDLAWEAVAFATTYRVYRSENSNFSSPQLLVTLQSTDLAYTDNTVSQNKMFYYEVTAHAITESPPSNRVDIFVPSEDLPAPQNFRVEWVRGDGVRLAWDWADADPLEFRVYFSLFPDFRLDGGLWKVVSVGGDLRQVTQFGLQQNTTYYCRVQAWNVGRGRPTDDIPFTTTGFWTWDANELVATGAGPIAATEAAGDISVAYFSGFEVMVARRSAGTWNSETSELNDALVDGGFSLFTDIAYGGGSHIVLGRPPLPGDLWCSVGNPGGSWTTTRIHGDGGTGLGHPDSGNFCEVAASDTEFAVMHLEQGEFSETVHVQSAPIAGAWSTEDTYNLVFEPLDCSLAFDSGNLYGLIMDFDSHELNFADRDGSWNWSDIASSGGTNVGLYNDLNRLSTGWITPCFDGATKEVKVFEESAGSWSSSVVGDGFGGVSGIKMAILDDQPLMIWLGNGPVHWYFGWYDGTQWQYSSLSVYVPAPGDGVGDFVDLIEVAGEPWVVFTDHDGKIRASRGIPPV